MQNDIEHLQKYLERKMPDQELPEIQAALIFTHDKVEIKVDEDETPPAPTLYLNKLKEFIRKTAKNKPVSLEKIVQVQQALNLEQPANDQ
jgi:hypothetical protein